MADTQALAIAVDDPHDVAFLQLAAVLGYCAREYPGMKSAQALVFALA